MSAAAKKIMKELKEAALKGFAHADHKLHELTGRIDGHLDDVVRQVRDTDRFDVKIKPFNKKAEHSQTEYDSQYKEQMDTLQNMPLSDWLKNRIEYLGKGRTSDSERAQEATRDVALNKKIAELRRQGMELDDAKAEAAKWMKTQAALHRLDGIAGGDVTDVPRVGDTGVNSSLGAQWAWRVNDIDRAVIDFLDANPGVDMDNTFMNIVFR